MTRVCQTEIRESRRAGPGPLSGIGVITIIVILTESDLMTIQRSRSSSLHARSEHPQTRPEPGHRQQAPGQQRLLLEQGEVTGIRHFLQLPSLGRAEEWDEVRQNHSTQGTACKVQSQVHSHVLLETGSKLSRLTSFLRV